MADQEQQNSGEENEKGDGKESGVAGEAGKIAGGVEAATAGKFTSPEGIVMFCVASMFDGIGLIPIVGDFSDVFAGIFFITWMIATGKKGFWKFFLALLLEAIPIVSDIAPFVSIIAIMLGSAWPASWIGFVYSVLKSN